jgi:hypothetical protein
MHIHAMRDTGSAATLPLHAVGMTDYYRTEPCGPVRAAKLGCRLSSRQLILPNVEMHLSIGEKRFLGERPWTARQIRYVPH